MPEAVPDGVRLAELIEALPLSRGSLFALVKALGITTAKGPGPHGRGRVAWLSAADAARVTEAAHLVHAGNAKIADLAGGLQRRPTRQTLQAAPRAASGHYADPGDPGDPGPFLARLQAAELAIRSGMALTTAEATWILGVKPGSSPIVRGGIKATRTGRNCWRLQSADSGDAARH